MYSLGYRSSSNQDSRHSSASGVPALGERLPMIGKLLGHSQIQTTARYAQLARHSVKASAVRVAVSIGADYLPTTPRSDSVGARQDHARSQE